MIGKTNMDEFAMGSTTETSLLWRDKESRGIWSMYRVDLPVAPVRQLRLWKYHMLLDLTPADRSVSQVLTAESLESSPTYGTVSRYGLIAYGSSLDQIGPVARDVTDCATVLETIASHDVKGHVLR